MNFVEINGKEEFLKWTSEGVSIVLFPPTWFPSRAMIEDYFNHFATNNTNLKFLLVDCQKNPDLEVSCDICVTPTFQVFSNGTQVEEMIGNDKEEFQSLVNKYSRMNQNII